MSIQLFYQLIPIRFHWYISSIAFILSQQIPKKKVKKKSETLIQKNHQFSIKNQFDV